MENRIAEIRKQKKIRQADVASYIGVAKSTYTGYETNYHNPTPEILCKIADFLSVTVDELLGRTSTPALFDNARVERPEILELYDSLTPAQQNNLLSYARGMAANNSLLFDENIRVKKSYKV